MRAPLSKVVVALVTLVSPAIPAAAHRACASNHIQARLDVFSAGSESLPLYWAEESQGQATITLRILGLSCDGSQSTVSWEVQPGSADFTDYSPATTPFQWANTVGHSPTQQRQVTITNDALPLDRGVETATVVLGEGSNVRLEPPTSAELVILDDDRPTPQVSLVEGDYQESETSGAGGVPVFRGGSSSGVTTVDYTLSGGTASAGEDYQGATSGKLEFAPGERMKLIPIAVVDDSEREPSETVDVSISGADVDPQGPPSVTFTIIDNEESLPPSSSLHHPNQGKRYRPTMYLIREIHIFTSDEGGAGTVAAEFALRRNMKDKSCAWWNGKRFKKGSCYAERWLGTDQYETDFFYLRLKELDASVGSIRNYTAYSRAIDGAKNLESDFEVGRNANTFEIKKPR